MLVYNLDEEAKSQKFLGGLKLEIQLALSSLGARTYAEVVMQALRVESNLAWMNALKVEVQEPERNPEKKHHLGVRGGNFKPKSRCPKCQRFHPGRGCQSRTQGCYSCGRNDPNVLIFRRSVISQGIAHKENKLIKQEQVGETKNHDEVGCII